MSRNHSRCPARHHPSSGLVQKPTLRWMVYCLRLPLLAMGRNLRPLPLEGGSVRTPHRFVSLALLLLAGCATKTQTGAVVGTAGGAVLGGVIGKVAGSTAKGAIIGAVVGGAAGIIIGAQMDKQAKELEQNIKGATVERAGGGLQGT